MNKKRILDPNKCVHCGKCTKNCEFLKKYNFDICDIEKHKDLIYHCYLCGKCSEVCSIGIDGKNIILNLRREEVLNNKGRLKEKGYEFLLLEKKNYLFKNYKNSLSKQVIFPGCSFTSLFPNSSKLIMKKFKEEYNIGTVFDCCGKPISELGLEIEDKANYIRLNKFFKKYGIEELITICPNCYAFLKPNVDIKITSIYEKLQELNIGSIIDEDLLIYPNCQERGDYGMFKFIKPFISGDIKFINNIQCCGLGGCAFSKEPEISKKLGSSLNDSDAFYTYCASCSGTFSRNGSTKSEHILFKILGLSENPDTKKGLLNRISSRWW